MFDKQDQTLEWSQESIILQDRSLKFNLLDRSSPNIHIKIAKL